MSFDLYITKVMDKRIPPVVPTLEELKRMIKQENISSGRLQSLRLPRDLSLGGTKPKKVYTPNLNVVRHKDKNKHYITVDRSQKKAGNSSRGQKRLAESSLSRDKNKHGRFVQSDGVFSQGMGDVKRSSHCFTRSASTREQNSTATLTMPKFSKSGWNVNKNKETALVNELINDQESDSDSDTEYDPVVLPLDRNKNSFVNCFKIKQEDRFDKVKKEESCDLTEMTVPLLSNGCSTIPDVKPKIKIEKIDDEPQTERYNAFMDNTQGYDEDNPAFSLIRLPDSFLGKTWKEDPKDKDIDYTVKHMSEGHVGKILVRKSGKMEMVIRNTNYALNVEDSEGLRETAMLFPGEQSIALEPSLVTLGTVTEKFALTPDWNGLFDRARKKHKFYW